MPTTTMTMTTMVSETATGTPPTSNFGSIFQSAGGPPLILVCIAAGLLLGAFVGMFLIKRVRPPSVIVHRVNRPAGADGEATLGEKPCLFDIHVLPPPEQRGGGEAGAWAHAAPFAAVYLPLPAPAPPPAPAPTSAPTQSRSPLSRLAALLRRTSRSRPSTRLSAPPTAGASTPEPALRSVQLAFAVCMPNSALRAPKSADVSEYEDPMPDCALGTVVLPYRLGAA